MAFVKKTWKDRIVQYANRRLLTKSGGEVEQVTVTRDEGTISEAGDQFNASNMNNLEQRVKDGFDDLNAADLPITSGSATNTKDYIDSGLSGKADNSDLSWAYVGATNDGGQGVNIADYNEIMVVPLINGTAKYNPYMFWKSILNTNVSITVYRSSAYNWVGTMSMTSNVLSIQNNELNGWTSVTLYVYGRKL